MPETRSTKKNMLACVQDRENSQMAKHWIVNLETKTYFVVEDHDGTFFDDEWKAKTPFRDSSYIDLSTQTVRENQKKGDYLFYDADLCRSGLIVGIYADEQKVTRQEAEQFLEELRCKQDVASAYIHMLTREVSPENDCECEESDADYGPR